MSIFTVSTGTDKPTLKLWRRHIRNHIAPKWHDLGVELLDEEHDSSLNIIAENERNVEDRCTKMFECWLRVDADASWNKVIKALNNLKHYSLVKQIKREILKGVVVTLYINSYVCIYYFCIITLVKIILCNS